MAPLREAQGAFYHGSLYSVTVPTREGPGTVCGSSWGSGEVLDRVADLHTGPIQSPAQTQHCQQDDKCPGCIDASISPCMLPCAKLKKIKRTTMGLLLISHHFLGNLVTVTGNSSLSFCPLHVATFRDLLKGPVVQLPPARQEDTQTIPDTCQFFFMSDNFLIATESKSLLCSILGIKKIAVFNSDNIDFICLFQM